MDRIHYLLSDQEYLYRLSYGHEITEGMNLNDIQTIGSYYCSTNVITYSLYNCPVIEAFTMKVELSTGNGYLCQSLREFTSGRIFYRYYDSAWGNWVTPIHPHRENTFTQKVYFTNNLYTGNTNVCIKADYNIDSNYRASLGFLNSGVNGATVFLDTDRCFKYIEHDGTWGNFLTSRSCQVSGNTLTIYL